MDNNTILVLSDPTDRQLAMLGSLPDSTSIAVGNNVEAFERLAPEAQVIFNWSGSRQLVQQVWKMAPRVEWVHSRAAGLDGLLFPELVESPVLLTNGSGVFSQSLGEFVIASALFFAKDFRRMIRNQEAGVWAPFDRRRGARADHGHRRIRRYRPRLRPARARHGDESARAAPPAGAVAR